MKNFNIKPLNDLVVIKVDKVEQTAPSGIILPDVLKQTPDRGTVVAVGKGKKDEPMTLKVGDKVIYPKSAGTSVIIDVEDFLIMRQSLILGTI